MNAVKKMDKKQVAINLRKLVVESNLTNEEISNQLNINVRLLYYWLNGKRVPSFENAYGISQLFNVPMESILA